MKSVVIIGAGIGGLCTGIELLLQGYAVSIYEKNDGAGGVLRSITSPDGAYRFEESASIQINPNTYHEFFKALGLDPHAYFCDQGLKTLYHVFSHDGKTLCVPHDLSAMKAALEKDFSGDVSGWGRFMSATAYKLQLSKQYFIHRPFMTVSSILNPNLLCKLVALNPFSSAKRYVCRFIKSELLQNFILFQAFYVGIAPDRLPNLYTTVYTSAQLEGISHIQGGLSHFASVLTQIFTDQGGMIYYNTPAQRILGKGSLVTGVQVGNQVIKSDIVVVNADYCYAQKELLNRKLHRYSQPSCSTYIVHLGLTRKYAELGVHNLYINKNFLEELSRIFQGKLPQNPSLYLYSPSAVDDSYCKNPSHSVINLMLRVPNRKDLPISWDEATKEQLYAVCLRAVSSIEGLATIKDHIAYRSITTPMHFESRYHCQYGSCFGIGHTLLQSMALRPQLLDKHYKNLYYVGSSIHPGNGASIVMNGAQMVCKAICQNHPLESWAPLRRGNSRENKTNLL